MDISNVSRRILVVFALAAACLGVQIPMNTLWSRSIYCAHSQSHIGCKFIKDPGSSLTSSPVTYDMSDKPSLGTGCGSVLTRGLKEVQKKTILDAHNARRSELASGTIYANLPAAANMAKLVWDPQAAGLAQLYADQCTQEIPRGIETLLPDGDAVRNYQIKYMESPNITAEEEENTVLSSSTMDFVRAVDIWFDQVEKFVLDDVYQYVPDLRTTKFTQLAWANTLAVGCGYIKYKVEAAAITDPNFLKDLGDVNLTEVIGEEHKTWINEELVCHYAPGGNLAGHPIYTPGKPCSACPTYLPVCKDFLCSAIN